MKRSLAALLLVFASMAPAQADATQLQVGRTGILCYMAPCPWRGIAEPAPDGADPARLLWSGDELPPMTGTPAHQRELSRAWREFDCLLVAGGFEGGVLRVDDILGSC